MYGAGALQTLGSLNEMASPSGVRHCVGSREVAEERSKLDRRLPRLFRGDVNGQCSLLSTSTGGPRSPALACTRASITSS